ncbi:LytR/AlgR family response regulator transcription factor [Ekhidna sp.]
MFQSRFFLQPILIPKYSKKEVAITLLIALSSVYFIFVFLEPFNFEIGDNNKYLVFLPFVLTYFLVLFVSGAFIIPFAIKVIGLKKYFFHHLLVGYFFQIFLIALAHHVLQNYLNSHALFNGEEFLSILSNAIFIGVIPTLITALIYYNKALLKQTRENLIESNIKIKKVDQNGYTTIQSTNEKNIFRCKSSTIIYLKSEDNYVNIFYQTDEGEDFKNELIRNTMKQIEPQLPIPFLRVHRSYIVNLNHIYKIEGNSQGMLLRITNSETTIPVSRNYIQTLKNSLDSI